MLETQNLIKLKGTVTGFKIQTNDTGKDRASITIKDTVRNKYANVTLFDNGRKVKFGKKSKEKGDAKEYTFSQLKDVFLDKDGKSKDVRVTVIGSINAYAGKNGVRTSIIAFSIYPNDEENNDDLIFTLEGFLAGRKNTTEDDDKEKSCEVKVELYNYAGSKEDRRITGMQAVTLTAKGDVVEQLMKQEVGSFIAVAGVFYNSFSVDRFGWNKGGSGINFEVVQVKTLFNEEEISSNDKEISRKAVNATKDSPIFLNKDKKVDEEEPWD